MQRPLKVQLALIMGLSLILAVGNNLRPKAKIQWIRDWPAYSKLAQPVEVEQPDTPAAEVEPVAVDESEIEAQTAELVTTNSGITDISIEQALNIYKYASDFTVWIDARSPELYEEGHIKGAHLLHLYEKNTYLPQVDAVIQEHQPAALVIYCKGKDCTDSHHLAQDMEAQGFGNIFVYKDGFDDWYRAGHPIEGNLAAEQTVAESGSQDQSEGADEEKAAMVMDRVASNFGITDINLDEALDIYKHASEITLWIDARSPELFQEGHIKGAHLLHFYDMNQYMDQVKSVIDQLQPISLVVYCKGKDCTDSHHLALDLQGQGFDNIFVYKNGFQDWYEGGHPIEGALVADATVAAHTADHQEPVPRAALEEEKPKGMYLEHIIRDMAPFLFGLVLMMVWSKVRDNKKVLFVSALFAGGFFIYAAAPKIAIPMLFAKNIWNYDIVPGYLVNISALILPMVELTIAVCMISGTWRRGGSLIMSVLLVIFIIAVGFNVLRGHEFDCGCTASEPMWPDLYIAGWNDKYTLILRDLGLLAMSVLVFLRKDDREA